MDVPLLHSSADPPLQLGVQLLGRFAVSVGSDGIPAQRWPSLRATHLVQLLSLQPRHRMTRDQVIDALWPQLEPEAGAANLRKATHHARQALGRHDALVVQGGELALWPDRPLVVDAEAFARRAEAALARRDAAECAEAAREYAGDLLPGGRYEAWAEVARERMHARYVDLLRASAQWEKLAQLEPTDEPAHRALMQRELQSGNRAAALRWYAHLREALQQSLAVLPDRQTEAQYGRCLAGLQWSGPAFVGRALPLAQVTAWLGMAADERPGGIVLRGPSGIGKSALCREIGTQARGRGWEVLRVEMTRGGRTYAVVSSIAERLLLADRGLLDRIGPAARNVLALLSPLAAPADALQGPLGRHQVVGAVRRLLVASAAGADLLLQVDDAHLADDADIDVLLQLAAAGAPVCVLLSTRPPTAGTALARGVARLHRAGVLRQLDAEPLDDDECRRLVLRVAGKPLPDAIVAGVLRAADGNAFAAIELARCAAAAGDRKLPASTADAILERLCDVPDHALALLKWLALCGDSFDVATIESLAGSAQASPMVALDACLMEGVLLPSSVGRPLPLPARAGPTGARRSGAGSPTGKDASRGGRTARPAGRGARRHRAALAGGRQAARCRALAAGRRARRGAAGRVQRRPAPPRALARVRARPPGSVAIARRISGRSGRSRRARGLSPRRGRRRRTRGTRPARESRAGPGEAG
ncbi:MAG: AAA family ATPase [Burkholderiales bacterium]|nr:AAA family ATPase [Burkholderiales bacterium]